MIKVAVDDASFRSRSCNDLWCTGYYLPTGPSNKHKFDRDRVKKPGYPITVDNKGHIYFRFQLKKRFYSLDEKQRLEEITRFVETAYRTAGEPG